MMVPAIDGYNNTIKSEMEPPCPRQALPQTPALQGSVKAGAGLTIQLALNRFPYRAGFPRPPVHRILRSGHGHPARTHCNGDVPLNPESHSTDRGITGRSQGITGNYMNGCTPAGRPLSYQGGEPCALVEGRGELRKTVGADLVSALYPRRRGGPGGHQVRPYGVVFFLALKKKRPFSHQFYTATPGRALRNHT